MSEAEMTMEGLRVWRMRLVGEMIPNPALKARWVAAVADVESGRWSKDAATGAAITAAIFRRQTAGGLAAAAPDKSA